MDKKAFYDLAIETVKNEISESITSENEVMGIKHKKYLIEGVQFHPEIMYKYDEFAKTIIKDFVKTCSL